MNKIVKNTIKNGLIFVLVGALLAAVSPFLADAMGGAAVLGEATYAHAQATSVLWTAAFFGGFGAIHSAVAGVLGNEEKPAAKTHHVAASAHKAQSPHIVIAMHNAPEVSHAHINAANFREKLSNERENPASQQPNI